MKPSNIIHISHPTYLTPIRLSSSQLQQCFLLTVDPANTWCITHKHFPQWPSRETHGLHFIESGILLNPSPVPVWLESRAFLWGNIWTLVRPCTERECHHSKLNSRNDFLFLIIQSISTFISNQIFACTIHFVFLEGEIVIPLQVKVYWW